MGLSGLTNPEIASYQNKSNSLMRSEPPIWDRNRVFKCGAFISDGGNQSLTHTEIYKKRNLNKH